MLIKTKALDQIIRNIQKSWDLPWFEEEKSLSLCHLVELEDGSTYCFHNKQKKSSQYNALHYAVDFPKKRRGRPVEKNKKTKIQIQIEMKGMTFGSIVK
jgi:hypothetical protein